MGREEKPCAGQNMFLGVQFEKFFELIGEVIYGMNCFWAFWDFNGEDHGSKFSVIEGVNIAVKETGFASSSAVEQIRYLR